MGDFLLTKQITFLGAGSMAEAIIRGLLQQQKVASRQILALNRSNKSKLERLKADYHIQIGHVNEISAEQLRKTDIFILAMKPKDAGAAISALQTIVHGKQLIISMVAGLSLNTIDLLLKQQLSIVRTMPNTSSTIGLGMTGISFSNKVTEDQRIITGEIFSAIGEVVLVPEEQLDILTGVSGCGPAYVYYMIEAMISGGMKGGLSADDARRLAIQTVLGVASMVKQTGEDPAILRQKVTSPNGATQAGLEMLNQFHFNQAVEQAVQRAAERSGELGEMIKQEVRNDQ